MNQERLFRNSREPCYTTSRIRDDFLEVQWSVVRCPLSVASGRTPLLCNRSIETPFNSIKENNCLRTTDYGQLTDNGLLTGNGQLPKAYGTQRTLRHS